MIFALAGRRIDAPGSLPVRFPLHNVELVRARLQALFEQHPQGTLVSSAACGSDLLGLETAGALGWRRRVVLPFDRDRFRYSSVTDRPGDWGPLYDRIIEEVQALGDLSTAPPIAGADPDRAYALVNERILQEAARMAAGRVERQRVIAVWDGASRGPDDLTQSFVVTAKERGITVIQVSTLE